jgi:membrane protein YqaA with SNARE-associated domain
MKNLFTQGDKIIEKFSKTEHLFPVTFCVAFLEATISPILPEAFLLLVLAYRKDISWKLLSVISALGSSFGALSMYLLGNLLYSTYGQTIITFLHGGDVVEKARTLFSHNVFMAQFLAALTPLPDRVFSFLAGAFLVSPFLVFVATFLGRLIRILPIAYLSYEYGDEARFYIMKHTKTMMYVVFGFLVCWSIYSYIL